MRPTTAGSNLRHRHSTSSSNRDEAVLTQLVALTSQTAQSMASIQSQNAQILDLLTNIYKNQTNKGKPAIQFVNPKSKQLAIKDGGKKTHYFKSDAPPLKYGDLPTIHEHPADHDNTKIEVIQTPKDASLRLQFGETRARIKSDAKSPYKKTEIKEIESPVHQKLDKPSAPVPLSPSSPPQLLPDSIQSSKLHPHRPVPHMIRTFSYASDNRTTKKLSPKATNHFVEEDLREASVNKSGRGGMDSPHKGDTL